MKFNGMSPEAQSYFDHIAEENKKFKQSNIIAIIEMPNEEIYFLNLDKMNNNDSQREYKEAIMDAIEDSEGCDQVSLPPNIALSHGGYNALHTALEELPCIVTKYLFVEVEE